jgi:Rrf2 family transcriptional regulator, iron-sulfur cluster assembly transcription factor
MKITTKIRYGVRLICDIAFYSEGKPVQVKTVSKRQEISAKYTEQIFQKLKKAGVIKSVRGPFGGYLLAKNPEEITVGDIIKAIDGKEIELVFCSGYPQGVKKPCKRFRECVVSDVWEGASRSLMDYFNSITINQICVRAREKGHA